MELALQIVLVITSLLTVFVIGIWLVSIVGMALRIKYNA